MSSDNSNDVIHRFMFEDSDIRGEIITLSRTFQDALAAQKIPPALKPLFGEFLVGAAMMIDILKTEGVLTLQARGDGPVPLIMAESTNNGRLRGILTADNTDSVILDDSDDAKPLGELIGHGALSLTLDPKQGKRYQGIVPLDGRNLGACLDHYFEQSEQIPTRVILFCDGERCGGLFLQCLPTQNLTDIEAREEQWQTTLQLAATLKADEFFGVDHATVLYRLFHEQSCRVFEPKQLQFHCGCSKTRSARALHALQTEELLEIVAQRGDVTLDCQFCGKAYVYTKEDILALEAGRKTLH